MLRLTKFNHHTNIKKKNYVFHNSQLPKFSVLNNYYQPRIITNDFLTKQQQRHEFHSKNTNNNSNNNTAHKQENTEHKKKQHLSTWKIVTTMGEYLWAKDNKAFKVRVVTSVGLLIISKVLNVQVPYFFKEILDNLNNAINKPNIITQHSLNNNDDTQQTIVDSIHSNDIEAAITSSSTSSSINEILVNNNDVIISNLVVLPTGLICMYGLVKLGSSLFNELRNTVFAEVAHQAVRSVSKKTLSHLHQLDLAYHLNRETGSLFKIIDRGSRGITWGLNAMVFHIIPTIFELVLVCSILSYHFGHSYSIITMSTITLYTLFTIIITQWRTKLRRDLNKTEETANTKIIESLLNYETVKYFNNEKYELERYDESLKLIAKLSSKTQSSLALLNFGQNFIFAAAFTGVMYLSAQQVIRGEMTIGDMVMLNGFLMQLSMPLSFLGTIYREFRQSITDMENMFIILNQKPTIVNSMNAKPLILPPNPNYHRHQSGHDSQIICNDVNMEKSDVLVDESGNYSAHLSGDIEFKDVTFGYDDQRIILNNFNLTIKEGKTVAFVGESGSGKSTIMRLLFRFYDPIKGEITINGQNLKNVELDSLRNQISVIPQDTVLFNDTLFQNILYGNVNAGKEQVLSVAKSAQIDKIVQKLPLGYDTKVGERGLKLSGGEKQRVSIARALLKGSPILLCDEATSSLDSSTEKEIIRELYQLAKNRTTIVIAHRLSTIIDCDEIIVIGNGAVVEKGTHYELLNIPNGVYRKLWEYQTETQETKE